MVMTWVGRWSVVLALASSMGCLEVGTAPTGQAAAERPVAQAGLDRTVSTGELVTLDGSGSSVAGGLALEYVWTFVRMPAGSLAGMNNHAIADPSFIPDVPGSYLVQLLVAIPGQRDPAWSAPDQVTVTATPNHVPQADAGGNQQVVRGQPVILDGSRSSDVDGDNLAFAWQMIAKPPASQTQIDDAAAGTTFFTADVIGTYLVGLTVNDGTIGSQISRALISANDPTADAPTAVAGADRTNVTVGTTVLLDGAASTDPLGRTLSYQWSFLVRPPGSAVELANASLVQAAFVPDVLGTYSVVLVATSAGGASAPDSVQISVSNRQPIAAAGASQYVQVGDITTIAAAASTDPDGQTLTYTWRLTSKPATSTRSLTSTTSATTTLQPDKVGTYSIELIVNDGIIDSLPDDVQVFARDPSANTPPVANAGADQTVKTLGTATLDGSASFDADGNSLTYDWTLAGRPALSGAILTGAASAAPQLLPDVSGTYTVTLVVNDGAAGSIADTVTLTANFAPVAVVAAVTGRVLLNTAVDLDGSDSHDDDGNPLTYAWTLAVPAGSGAVLSPSAAVATPTFTPDVDGRYTATLVVDDGFFDSAPVIVNVNASATMLNTRPVANAGPDQLAAPAGTLVLLDGGASSDPDGDFLTYSWSFVAMPASAQSLPAFNAATIVNPTFTPPVNGDYRIALMVNDGQASSAVDEVLVRAVNSAPVANAGPDATVLTARPVLLDGSASYDPNRDPFTYSWSFVSRPGGSSAALTGAATVSPLFTPDLIGAYVVRLQVNDGAQNSAPDTVTVTAISSAPSANAGADVGAHVGDTVALDGGASTDPGGLPLTYSWRLLSTPSGVAAPLLTGAASATPSFVPLARGLYSLELVVTNSNGTASQPDRVEVMVVALPTANAGPDRFSMAGNSCFAPLSGHTPLAGGVEIDGLAGAAVVGWQITAAPGGSGLAGLSASGTDFSFAPDLAGSYTARLSVTDGFGGAAYDDVVIVAQAPRLSTATVPAVSAPVTSTPATPWRVQVDTSSGLLDSGCLTVRFSASGLGGDVVVHSATTNGSGIAETAVVLGETAGVNTYRAELQDNPNINTSINVTGLPGAAWFIVLDEPAAGSVDAPVTLTARLMDRFFNTVTTDNTTQFTLTAGGAATFGGYGGPQSQLVTVASGVVSRQLYDQVAETVQVGVSDTALTGLRLFGKRTELWTDLETAAAGFHSESRSQFASGVAGDDDWQHGTPTVVGPSAGHSGTKVWGTNLSGLHSFQADAALVKDDVDLTDVAPGIERAALLTFWHYRDIRNDQCETWASGGTETGALALFGTSPPGAAYVESLEQPTPRSADGGYHINQCGTQMGCVWGWACDSGWAQAEFDLSRWRGYHRDLEWAFFYDSPTSPRGAGWYIDDVRLDVITEGTTAVAFSPGAAKSVALLQPENARKNTTMIVDLEVRDQYGNRVVGDNASTFTVNVTGGASFTGVPAGILVSGLNTQALRVQVAAGAAQLLVLDAIREQVTLSVSAPAPATLVLPGSKSAWFTNPPAMICKVAGDAQTATVGTLLPAALQVRVIDQVVAVATCAAGVTTVGSGGMVGFTVTAGGGTVSESPTTLDGAGLTETTYNVGTVAGANTVHASVVGQATLFVDFAATGAPDVPVTIVVAQPAHRQVTQATTVDAALHDQYGNVTTNNSTAIFKLQVESSAATATLGVPTVGSRVSFGSNWARLQVANGAVRLPLFDATAESVNLRAVDSESLGVAITPDYDQELWTNFKAGGVGTTRFAFPGVPQLAQPVTITMFSRFGCFDSGAGINVYAETEAGIFLGKVLRGYHCQPWLLSEDLQLSASTYLSLVADNVLGLETRTDLGVSSWGRDYLGARLVVPGGGVPVLFQGNDLCAGAVALDAAPAVIGGTIGAGNNYAGPSGYTAEPGPDVVYSMALDGADPAKDCFGVVVTPESASFDLGAYVVTDCANISATLVSYYDYNPAGGAESPSGCVGGGPTPVYLIVDANDAASAGNFKIEARIY
ncbi:MAG: hypothetical protein HY903_13530 [Deltaproteobacteria bacterium]|nr:hypothetical protein [Deltaproteobacteria bacterium]